MQSQRQSQSRHIILWTNHTSKVVLLIKCVPYCIARLYVLPKKVSVSCYLFHLFFIVCVYIQCNMLDFFGSFSLGLSSDVGTLLCRRDLRCSLWSFLRHLFCWPTILCLTSSSTSPTCLRVLPFLFLPSLKRLTLCCLSYLAFAFPTLGYGLTCASGRELLVRLLDLFVTAIFCHVSS